MEWFIGYKCRHQFDLELMAVRAGMSIEELTDPNEWHFPHPRRIEKLVEFNDTHMIFHFPHTVDIIWILNKRPEILREDLGYELINY